MRPRTEDFLTFLCFRGTNALPKELDFQNNASTSGTSKASPDKKPKDGKSDPKKKPGTKKNETVTSNNDSDVAKKPAASETDPKTGFMPFAVRKRAEMHPAKNDKKKLQMVAKKKPQEKKEDTSNAPRATRANPVEEKAEESHNNNSTKKNAKRKSVPGDESQSSSVVKESETSSDKKTPSGTANKKVTKKEAKESAKAEEEKRQTRLSAVKGPSTSTPKPETAPNGIESHLSDKYFTSDDDDEPLVKSEPKNKKAKLNDLSTKTIANNSVDHKIKPDDELPVKSKRGRKKKIVVPPPEPESSPEKIEIKAEAEVPVEKKKVGRKKKTNPDLEIANSQANTTDLSENEARGRPMRKTKEAATIYMELIGRKLTLHDSSDNDSSLDSLEVPNLRRVELMENELKANCEKAKEAVAEKKKLEDKQVGHMMMNQML